MHQLLMYIHKLEKAMHMPDRRDSFGHEVVMKIKELMPLYPELEATAKSTLEKYNHNTVNSSPVAMLPDNSFNVLQDIMLSRQSVRNFSKRKVSVKKIIKAIELAVTMPSACNRQPCEVLLLKDRLKKEILNIHCGSAGFVAPILAVVTYDKKAFFQDFEENSGMLHAGVFSAGLVLALRAQKIDTCVLNWHVSPEVDDKANNLLFLQDKKISLLILIGYSNKKPEAYSYKLKNIYKIL